MTCDTESLVATSYVISLDSAKVESEATINGITIDAYYIGDTINDVYLFTYNYKDTNKGYKLDPASNQIVPIDFTFPHTWTPQELYPSSEGRVSESNLDGSYVVNFDRRQIGDIITISVSAGNAVNERNLQIPVRADKYNYLSSNSDTQITGYAFDPVSQNIFWIATDRGLVRLDVNTLTYRLFTTTDGLASDKISKIIPVKEVLAIQHPNGVYLYRF